MFLKKAATLAADIVEARRGAVIELVGEAFDDHIEPVDLPGPDAVIDPYIRMVIVATAEKLYSVASAKLRKVADDV